MSKEKLGVKDSIELVLKKADGSIITNEATIPITADYLKKLLKEMGESDVDE